MSRQQLDTTIAATLDEWELSYERKSPGRFFVTLPGTKKLQTNTWLVAGEYAFLVEAFVCRRPDEEHEAVYRFLLRRNAKLYGVHYTIDDAGDIYLIGRLPLGSVDSAELDRLLGQVLEAADGDFNTLLEIGFANSIRREWDWRVSRGESLANLQAFEHLVREDDTSSSGAGRPRGEGSHTLEPPRTKPPRRRSPERGTPRDAGGSRFDGGVRTADSSLSDRGVHGSQSAGSDVNLSEADGDHKS